MAHPPEDDSKPDFSFLSGDDSPQEDGPEFPEELNFDAPQAADSAAAADQVAADSDQLPDFGSLDDPPAAIDAADMFSVTTPKTDVPSSTSSTENLTPPRAKTPSRPKQSKPKTRPKASQAGKRSDVTASDNSSSAAASDSEDPAETQSGSDTVPRSRFNALLGYAAALTLVFLYLLVSGRLSGTHSLESLPDIKPMEPGEFQSVPADAALPRHHELRLGESRRFGDVVITPEKVVLAPLEFERMADGETVPEMKTRPVMQLQFTMQNVAQDIGFAPFDVGLMSHRSPEGGEGVDDSVLASSALYVHDSGDQVTRVLNYLHAAESSFDISGQNSRQILSPGESTSTLIVSSDAISEFTDSAASYRWRIHIRKGINRDSQQGVTTLVEVCFSPEEISPQDDA